MSGEEEMKGSADRQVRAPHYYSAAISPSAAPRRALR